MNVSGNFFASAVQIFAGIFNTLLMIGAVVLPIIVLVILNKILKILKKIEEKIK